jgi:hypothetical protein
VAPHARHLEAGDGRLVELFEEARLTRERWSRGASDLPAAADQRGSQR